MKRLHVTMAAAAVLIFGLGTPTVFTQQAPAAGTAPPRQWWVNKAQPGQFGKNKVHIKLAELKARHKGQANWTEVVVEDENYHATYSSGSPGTKITPRMRPDTREFFVVVEGEMRFTLEGQEPIMAKRGSVINIPKKTMYSAEVIGTVLALWVDANQSNFKTLVPVAEARPDQTPGHTPMKIGTTFSVGTYVGNNKPHFNLWDAEKDPKFAGQNVVQDDNMWAQAIWGFEKNLPTYDPNDKGHFHVGTAEWWLIMKGQIRHNIETVGDFTSNEGDVVYAPASTWHATRFAGPGPSCRLAISGYQFTSLLEQPQ